MYDLSFGMYFLYTDVQKNGAIGLVVLQTTEILGVRPQPWYVLLVHVEYKRMVPSLWSYFKQQRF